MKKARNYIIIGGSIALILFAAYTIWLISKPQPVEIQGEVEATQIKVASKIVGRLDSLAVSKGQSVNKGDLLFCIESPEVKAKLEQANAVKKAALAQKDKAYNGVRKEDIEAAYTTWKKAEAASALATKTYERINNLYKEGVVAEQKKDEAETQMIAAVETEKAAKSVYDKAINGAQVEDKRAAGALLEQAEGVVDEVTSYLNETFIFSPINGEIANIIAECGELVPTGFPVITIVDLNDVWITFNLREDLLSKIKKGTRFPAKFPALGNKEILLEVTYINVLGDYATWNATKTSGDFDMKTFEVHAKPVDSNDELRPGMSAIVNWSVIENK